MDREYDVLLWGVTGWTGVHLAEYFAENYGPDAGVKWAMCGRSKKKLRKVVERLLEQNFSWIEEIECIVVDNLDEEKVRDTVSRSSCVATVVGPYEKFGVEPLIKACVEQGTHYVDIAGEPQWIRKMIDKYHNQAMDNDTFIISSCGFDSIPSDLGVWTMVKYMREELNESCRQIRGYHIKTKGNNLSESGNGPPGLGGTIASTLNAVESSLSALLQPYYLTGSDNLNNADKFHIPQMHVGYESKLGKYRYTKVFPMAFINEKNVRRSNYLLNYSYGKRFSYHEASAVESFYTALLTSIGTVIGFLLLLLQPVRMLVLKYGPQVSSWPPQKPRVYKPGMFKFSFVGKSSSGKYCIGTVLGRDEPGWAETSKMLGESALALVFDRERITQESGYSGGVVTPAIMGSALVDRLTKKNMVFKVEKYKRS